MNDNEIMKYNAFIFLVTCISMYYISPWMFILGLIFGRGHTNEDD